MFKRCGYLLDIVKTNCGGDLIIVDPSIRNGVMIRVNKQGRIMGRQISVETDLSNQRPGN